MTREALTIEKRDASGKSPVARRLRQIGRVPGVLFGSDDPVAFSVDALEAAAVRRHGATLLDVTLDGKTQLAVVKEFQLHPVRGDIVHIDLQSVRMDQRVKTVAQVELYGDCPGVKAGGVLTQGARELSIESTPSDIPDSIRIDVSLVDLGETLILRDVTPPPGVNFLDDPGQMVVAISVPRGAKGARKGASSEDAGEPAAEAGSAEPAEG